MDRVEKATQVWKPLSLGQRVRITVGADRRATGTVSEILGTHQMNGFDLYAVARDRGGTRDTILPHGFGRALATPGACKNKCLRPVLKCIEVHALGSRISVPDGDSVSFRMKQLSALQTYVQSIATLAEAGLNSLCGSAATFSVDDISMEELPAILDWICKDGEWSDDRNSYASDPGTKGSFHLWFCRGPLQLYCGFYFAKAPFFQQPEAARKLAICLQRHPDEFFRQLAAAPKSSASRPTLPGK